MPDFTSAHDRVLYGVDKYGEPREHADIFDLVEVLRARYTPEPVPACRYREKLGTSAKGDPIWSEPCGAELTVQAMGDGPTKYAHPKPEGVTFGAWSEHYKWSTWAQPREGDSTVLDLLGRVEALLEVVPSAPYTCIDGADLHEALRVEPRDIGWDADTYERERPKK